MQTCELDLLACAIETAARQKTRSLDTEEFDPCS
jgi:hypothetical protein